MRIILATIAIGCLTVFFGCHNPGGNPSLATPAYPMELHSATSVPIQVMRHEEILEIVNSTATDYNNAVLWINQRFSAPLQPLLAGSTIQFNLWNLYDPYGEQLNAGGFWRTDRPTSVVIAELQTSENAPLVGLVVVNEE